MGMLKKARHESGRRGCRLRSPWGVIDAEDSLY